jgi:DnaJ-class molecular chaperone
LSAPLVDCPECVPLPGPEPGRTFCGECKGRGYFVGHRAGYSPIKEDCSDCQGLGHVMCEFCEGEGVVEETITEEEEEKACG